MRYECNPQYAPVAHLDRVSDYESEGSRFESCQAHQSGLLILGHIIYMPQDFFLFIFRKICPALRQRRYDLGPGSAASIQQGHGLEVIQDLFILEVFAYLVVAVTLKIWSSHAGLSEKRFTQFF